MDYNLKIVSHYVVHLKHIILYMNYTSMEKIFWAFGM